MLAENPGVDPEEFRDDMSDRAHETADGHEWVIYNHKALMICAHCNTEYGDDFLSEIGFKWTQDSTIYSVATAIVFGEMRGRIEFRLSELIDEHESEAA